MISINIESPLDILEKRKYWKYEGTFLWSHWVEGGIPDYDALFQTGLKGRIKMVEEKIEEIERDVPPDYIDQKEFLQAVMVILKAVINFANRYAVLAREMAASAEDEEEKARLMELGQTCERVPAEPPRTFLEAVQFFFLPCSKDVSSKARNVNNGSILP
jgi:formate C-acetyltransferase